MNFSGVYQREKRNPSQLYHPMYNSAASYWTEALQKSEMKHDFGDEYFLNNLHLIPDPLKKNLADSLFMNETPSKSVKLYQEKQTMTHQDQKVPLKSQNMPEKPPREANPGTTFGGIGSFFSGVLNVLTGVMFRSKSPVNYYDCFDVDTHQGSPLSWRPAKTDVQDKNGQADSRQSYDALSNPNVSSDMNIDSRTTVTSCETKLNRVLHLLPPKQTSSPVWVRKRPKKVFVEPGSVGESFEDAFSPEDLVSLPNDSYIEYYSPVQNHCEEFYEMASEKTKLNMAPATENTTIVKDVTIKSDLELKKDDSQLENNNLQWEKVDLQLEKDLILEKEQQEENKTVLVEDKTITENPSIKDQLVSSCEDKLSRLKALLQEKRMKCIKARDVPETSCTTPNVNPVEKKSADKRFKNPSRRCRKRPQTKLKCSIEEDLIFANEINCGTPPSVENSPMQHTIHLGDYFDEVTGRFRSASICSEDSFQIVFNDSPKLGRLRTTSDCDSEDSFIVFEDSPESCYMSNDVFGDSDDSGSESGMSDSGCGMVTCKLAHTLTRTFSNLADDSLYCESEDEVDYPRESVSVQEEQKSGLLLDEKKMLLRKSQPTKKVHFSTEPPKVHVMRVWAFAAKQARAGHWERYAIDRDRFKRRIADVDVAVSWVLNPQHRRRVMFQRFMPWWNQIKRKELAEKKELEAEEKRKEEQKKVEEEQKKIDENLRQTEEQTNIGEEQRQNEDVRLGAKGAIIQDEVHDSANEKQLGVNTKNCVKSKEIINLQDCPNEKVQKEPRRETCTEK